MSSLSVVCLGVLVVALVIVTLVYVDDEPVPSKVLEKTRSTEGAICGRLLCGCPGTSGPPGSKL